MLMAPDFARAINMNNELLAFQKLDSYKVARELARRVHTSRIRDAELRDQATRAAKSAFLGLCEGLPSDAAGIRRRHFDIANNSLHEVIGAIDLAAAIGALDEDVARELLSLAVRLKRMLRGLTR
jgi:four helix bundle protein